LGAIHDLAERYEGRVDFYVVYIREAHPEDGWVLTMNRQQDIAVTDPTTDVEREAAATSCAVGLKIRVPVVIDGMDDAVAGAYGGWPDRLYLIGRGGTVAFQGAEGPVGFVPADLEAAIELELATRS
jgi:hypothetical protein